MNNQLTSVPIDSKALHILGLTPPDGITAFDLFRGMLCTRTVQVIVAHSAFCRKRLLQCRGLSWYVFTEIRSSLFPAVIPHVLIAPTASSYQFPPVAIVRTSKAHILSSSPFSTTVHFRTYHEVLFDCPHRTVVNRKNNCICATCIGCSSFSISIQIQH